ncbi:hypothetical protein D9M68_694100 [compost metagenome]
MLSLCDLQVLLHRQQGEDAPMCGHQRDAAARDVVNRHACEIDAFEAHRPGMRTQQPDDRTHRRRLAHAIAPEHAHDLACIHMHRNAMQHMALAVGRIHVLQPQNGLTHD